MVAIRLFTSTVLLGEKARAKISTERDDHLRPLAGSARPVFSEARRHSNDSNLGTFSIVLGKSSRRWSS